MNDQATRYAVTDEEQDAANNAIGASIRIDYARIIALTEPDQPGGRIVFDSDNYETDAEADAALDKFFAKIIEAPYEENQTQAPVYQ